MRATSAAWSSRFTAEPARLDPYLLIAEAVGFVDHFPGTPPPDDEPAHRVSIEFKLSSSASAIEAAIQGLVLQPAHKDSRFATGMASLDALNALARDSSVLRTEWARPIVPQRPRPPALRSWPARSFQKSEGEQASGADRVLLAVIDNGCPFAHRDLRHKDGVDTRVWRLWDQNPAAGGDADAPAGFDYGTELTRSRLNALMKQAIGASGTVDEDRCYRSAGYEAMQPRSSHGAHALGSLAGARRWTGGPGAQHPLLSDGSDVAADSDIVFVQLPQTLMDSVSVAALEHHAIDAFRYIRGVAVAGEYARVIVSFGYESWIGPHDGSTWFEAALASLVDEEGVDEERVDMQVCLVAGNAKDQRAHARLGNGELSELSELSETLHLRLPPDQEIPTFVEIWAPSVIDDLRVRVCAPDGSQVLDLSKADAALAWPTYGDHAQVAAVMQGAPAQADAQAAAQQRHCSLLRWAPTRTDMNVRSAAAHGIWSIQIDSTRSLADVDVYVGRSRADMAAPRRGSQAVFIQRSPLQKSLDRERTLNGHACGTHPKIVVVGACYGEAFPYLEHPEHTLGRRRSTGYSASGPSNSARKRPDVSVPVDDGVFLTGRLGMGNRSAGVFRLSGTSAAAPQEARRAANAGVPGTPSEPGQKGSQVNADLALGEIRS